MEIVNASHSQRFALVRFFQQLLKEDPMVKKIGGTTSQLMLEAVRFHFEALPIKARVIVDEVAKKEEPVFAGMDEPEVEEKKSYEFTFKWSHPCLDYKVTITKVIPFEDFENM